MGGAIIQTRGHREGPIDIEILRTAILLSAHQIRHLPAGADPLPVGVPSNVGVLNAEGVAELFARQDHVHNHPAGLGTDLHHARIHVPTHLVGAADPLSVGVPVPVGTASAEGAATNFARRDHVHEGCRIATGTYTGDGAASQAITGLGFTPKHVHIILALDEYAYHYWKIDTMGIFASMLAFAGALVYRADIIISLDADGFTVGDTPAGDSPNENDNDYHYVAWG